MGAARQYDLVVMGATGFTGRLVAEYLSRTYGVGNSLRWAVAGRSQKKLDALLAELEPSAPGLKAVLADSNDADSLASLCQQTRAVCTTVGPYARYGSALVAACAAEGTHYCDLSGEPQWMRRMIDAHEHAARQSGARIVHACGFDSIPSDLGVFFLQGQAVERDGEVCDQVKFRLRAAKGTASGGTVASMLNAVSEARADRATAGSWSTPTAFIRRTSQKEKTSEISRG